MTTAEDISALLQISSDKDKKAVLQRFFKTGTGQYGENDIFLGVVVPKLRQIVKKHSDIEIDEVIKLLKSPIHEKRLIALYFLIDKYKKSDDNTKETIYKIYLNNITYINNWDLVDSSAEYIVGDFLIDKSKEPLINLSKSFDLWEKRISIIATFCYIKRGEYSTTLEIADILLNDKHNLIQKAIGWMLREVGKRCSQDILLDYLNKNSLKMARTTLRYAIERLTKEQKDFYLYRK